MPSPTVRQPRAGTCIAAFSGRLTPPCSANAPANRHTQNLFPKLGAIDPSTIIPCYFSSTSVGYMDCLNSVRYAQIHVERRMPWTRAALNREAGQLSQVMSCLKYPGTQGTTFEGIPQIKVSAAPKIAPVPCRRRWVSPIAALQRSFVMTAAYKFDSALLTPTVSGSSSSQQAQMSLRQAGGYREK